MAILIEKSQEIMGGILIDQIYLRIQYIANLSGKSLTYDAFPYLSKDAFLGDPYKNILKIDGLNLGGTIQYDSSANGEPLAYIHNEIKKNLSTDINSIQYILDPSTGIPVFDPSTGQPVTEEVLISPKFVEYNSISFVDID